jgi:hypothetical protein
MRRIPGSSGIAREWRRADGAIVRASARVPCDPARVCSSPQAPLPSPLRHGRTLACRAWNCLHPAGAASGPGVAGDESSESRLSSKERRTGRFCTTWHPAWQRRGVVWIPPWPGILTRQRPQDKSNGPDEGVTADDHCAPECVRADTQDEQESFLTSPSASHNAASRPPSVVVHHAVFSVAGARRASLLHATRERAIAPPFARMRVSCRIASLPTPVHPWSG